MLGLAIETNKVSGDLMAPEIYTDGSDKLL